jgi:hypothetical protein
LIAIASVAGTMIAKTITGTTFHVAPNFCISRIAVTTEIDTVTAATISNLVTRLTTCPFVFTIQLTFHFGFFFPE